MGMNIRLNFEPVRCCRQLWRDELRTPSGAENRTAREEELSELADEQTVLETRKAGTAGEGKSSNGGKQRVPVGGYRRGE